VLQSLRQALLLVGNIVQRYEGTSLHPSLAGAITPQLEQCLALLKRLSQAIAVYRKSLFPTVIARLWHRVCWNPWNPDELLTLRTELSAQRTLFGVFLHALNSSVTSLCITATPNPYMLPYFQCHMDRAWEQDARRWCINTTGICVRLAESSVLA
jgi:hypothetical protein